MTNRVLVVHPWLPEYRLTFFAQALEKLAALGVELTVAHGAPTLGVQGRMDAAAAEWAVPLTTRQSRVLGRDVIWRRLPSLHRYDLVILEQASGNLENYWPLLGQHLPGRPAVALWGHGRTYTHRVNRVDRALKRYLTNRASWFFAYTDAGAAHVVAQGFPRERVTVLGNTIDTEPIRSAITHVSEGEVTRFEQKYDLLGRTTLAYVGGLDASKRVPYLLNAFALMHQRDPTVVLLVAGDGVQRRLLMDSTLPVRYIGRAGPHEKALIARSAKLLLCPGRVGLVTVDSFAMGLPIVTTDWPYHAPEFEYLQHDQNAWITDDNIQEFASSCLHVLSDTERLERLSAACRASIDRYSISGMVDSFSQGVLLALDAIGRGSKRAA